MKGRRRFTLTISRPSMAPVIVNLQTTKTMRSYRKTLYYRVGKYVTRLLIDQLPKHAIFHNVQHTFNVVRGVKTIGQAEGLKKSDLEILILAAWFHDTGHTSVYSGHEIVSAEIARDFLKECDYPEARITRVEACIFATTMPQQPKNKLEMVMCDADLYHLSFPTYDHYQQLLREEWKTMLKKEYTDDEWQKLNDLFLHNHHYFTEYGKAVLEPKKWID